MLVIPVTDKTSWQNPPYLTIFLILTNCLVFFCMQGDEGNQRQRVADFYRSSHLAKIEAPLYEKHLHAINDNEKLKEFKEARKIYGPEAVYWIIKQDHKFSQKLLANKIITPEQKIFTSWRQKRDQIKVLLNQVFSFKYGHIPSRNSILTPFTYMFLHGSTMHLVGNMVFLWLLGSILELSCNRFAYLGGYLFTGYFAALFFSLIYHDSAVPLVGASGAIAGLMGAFTVIYGRGKVKIFYSLGFYFSYAKVYALLLLPFWIGRELWQIIFSGPSNVAFAAHIGGLSSGAALGFLQLKFYGAVQEEESNDDKEYKSALRLEDAMVKMANLDHDGARPIFAQILNDEPQNLMAMQQLYKIDKNNPQGANFQQTASRLLTRLCRRKEDSEHLLEIYREYCALCSPKLSRELYANLGQIFAGKGHLNQAAQITNFLLKNHPNLASIPGLLMRLGQEFAQSGQAEKSNNCLKILIGRYPDSPEAQIIKTATK